MSEYFAKWWRACTFHSQYCYILLAKKQVTLVQVDVSRVKGVISKETLFNKRDLLLLFLHRDIPGLACHGIRSRLSKTRLRNSSHRGEFAAGPFSKGEVLPRLNG